MVQLLGLLPQNTVLLLDIDILLLDHQLQLHFVLEPADRILYYLPYNLRLIRLLHITHDPVLVTPFFQLRRAVPGDHDKRYLIYDIPFL